MASYKAASATISSAVNSSFSVGEISKRSSLERIFCRILCFFIFSMEAAIRLVKPARSVLAARSYNTRFSTISSRATTARSPCVSACVSRWRRNRTSTESMKVSWARRNRIGTSRSPASAWRVNATCMSRSITRSRNRSCRRRWSTASSRRSTGHNLGWRRPSSEGPDRSCTSTRRVSNGSSPVSFMKRTVDAGAASAGAAAGSGKSILLILEEVDGRYCSLALHIVVAHPGDGLAGLGDHAIAAAQ